MYRHEYQLPNSNSNQLPQNPCDAPTMADIWDGSIYKSLRNRHIKIDARDLHQKYFADPHDIALGLTTDGFAPWRRRKYTAWPILLVNYNLPPEIRNHQKNMIAVSVIPGPKKPKDINSFLYPLIEELLTLANGVRAYDANMEELFCLRAFLMVAFGDIPAVSLLLKMKGHNVIVPCCICNIQGLRIPDSDAKIHYIPLDHLQHPKRGSISAYDPYKLPARTQMEFASNAQEVITAKTHAEEKRLGMKYGIKGRTILMSLKSLSFPFSFPYDFMHLLYENVLKNLILLWTNNYKDINVGTGNYVIDATVWDANGVATALACDTIPSVYSARMGSVAQDNSTFTADNYSFWALYIGPVLLQRKFKEARYYDHFVQLIHICLKFEYTASDIRSIQDGFINWVVAYER